MSSTRLKKVRSLLIAGLGIPAMSGLLAIGVMPGRAQALTINFDCVIPHNAGGLPGTTCVPGGNFGTLTLTQSAAPNNNRVDISWNLTPPGAFAGATMERILLNVTDSTIPGGQFRLMDVTAIIPPGSADTTPVIGAASYSSNTGKIGVYKFDTTVTSNLTGQNLTFPSGTVGTATLGFFINNVLQPLSPDFFDALTQANTNDPPGSGSPQLRAAYRLNQFDAPADCSNPANGIVGPPFPTNCEFWAGSTGVVPEPASLVLLGTGLVALSGLAARRRAAGKKTPVV